MEDGGGSDAGEGKAAIRRGLRRREDRATVERPALDPHADPAERLRRAPLCPQPVPRRGCIRAELQDAVRDRDQAVQVERTAARLVPPREHARMAGGPLGMGFCIGAPLARIEAKLDREEGR